jgi:glycosyltransferase involved in cell wall biosynthesis
VSVHPGFEKFYYLTVLNSCSASCAVCRAQNNLNPDTRDEAGLDRAFHRAVSGHYQAVVFPPNILDYPLRDRAFELAAQNSLQPVVQLHHACLPSNWQQEVLALVTRGCWIEVLFDTYSAAEHEAFTWLEKTAPHVYFTFVPTRTYEPLMVLKVLPPFILSKLHFYFAHDHQDPNLFLSCDEAYELRLRLREELPDLPLQLPPGLEIWDTRIPAEADLEPVSPVRYQWMTRLPQIQVSIVVITHQNRDQLVTTVNHLCKQKLSRDFYEIVVVDDGSDDGSFEAVRDYLQSLANPPNFKYILYERHSAPLAPIGAFRRGPARNLGAKHAQGPILVFVNSDLLCPNHFLEDVIKQHRSWDIVQYQRFFLKRSASSRKAEYARIDLATDSQASRGGYWEKFYLENDWKGLTNFWKYTSFAGFSIKSTLFHKVGGCLRTYVFSELEGAFLGYKLAQMDLRWKLRNLPLYEMAARRQSTRRNQTKQIRLEMRESARILFLNTLDPVVYAEYFEVMGAHWRMRWWTYQMGRFFLGRWLLVPLLKFLGTLRSRERLNRKLDRLHISKSEREYLKPQPLFAKTDLVFTGESTSLSAASSPDATLDDTSLEKLPPTPPVEVRDEL